jgi:multiple sugar transport system substrate-binding protein
MSRKPYKKLSILSAFLILVIFACFIALPSAQAKGVTVTWATIGGFYTDWAQELAKEYEAASGNKVKIIDIDYAQLYEKQVIEMVGGTGAYDIITYEAAWKPEFVGAGWLAPLDSYIKASKPEDIKIEKVSPALLELAAGWQGKTYGLPYYSFTMGYFYRLDLFEDPIEKKNFKAKYGYELNLPQTYEQMADIAEFFHRKKGEKLKGKVLDKEFYGIGLMAGRFPQIQDEIMSIVWTWGGHLIKNDGSPGTLDDIFLKAVDFYVNRLLPHAPPGATTSAYDEVVGQMRAGMIAQTAAFYLDQWPNMAKTEVEVPGSEMGAATSPGAHTWVGAFCLGLSKDSKHPNEAWEFIKFLTGPKGQQKFAKGGGTTCRTDILTDPAILKDNRAATAHFPVLVQVLEHNEKANFYPNFFYVQQSGKIYDEETTWFSSAASGQKPVKEAMASLAEAIERHCGGKCKVVNGHLGANYTPKPKEFTFDRNCWQRK